MDGGGVGVQVLPLWWLSMKAVRCVFCWVLSAPKAPGLWMQIHADTAGIPVRIPASTDAPSMGSAILAAHGAGYFASIDEGIDAMVKPGIMIEPDPAAMAAYDEVYEQYRALYPALKQIRG